MSRKHRGRIQGEALTKALPAPAGGVQLETFIPWTLVKRGWRKEVLTPPDAPHKLIHEARREPPPKPLDETPLLRALGLAFHWQRLLDEQLFSSMTEIAAAEGLDLGRASRISRLATLAPDIVDVMVSGSEQLITLETLGRQPLSMCWDKQRRRARPA